MEFPNRVWEPTGTKYIGDKEVTIWSSKEPTDEDRLRRRLAKHEVEKRIYEMKERIKEEDRRQKEQLLRRTG